MLIYKIYMRCSRVKGIGLWSESNALMVNKKHENRGIEYVAKAFGFEYLNLVIEELVKCYIVQSRHYRSKRGFSKYAVQIL